MRSVRDFKYDVISLIRYVRDRPCLWDKTLENYKDRTERRCAWEEIFNLLDESYEDMTPEEKRITGELILNKWTNIRDTFSKTLKTKMGKPKKKYVLHDHLEFLMKIIPDAANECHRDLNLEPSFMKQEPESSYTITTEIVPETSTDFTISNVTSFGTKKIDFDAAKAIDSASEASYTTKRSKSNFDTKSTDASEYSYRKNNRSKKKSKRSVYDDDESVSSRKKSRKSSIKDTNDDSSIIDSINDIDFVEVDTNDPRIMNEDEAFFASLLPTVVKYNENERLEFRLEVLGVMKKLRDKRNWTTD
ncbi:unnamed protein product [Spodoptera exigua]|uniref:MADF domain-containing protein n=1 Tax=Spodoptera exigua TaxID=7107 RepID=A0A922MDE6_SPOEX|nr:hypothetical protein HF086_010867 [Spodoptera exigua]CAH0697543.1 unnamed protein product [Spodoptera exigua]